MSEQAAKQTMLSIIRLCSYYYNKIVPIFASMAYIELKHCENEESALIPHFNLLVTAYLLVYLIVK